MSAGENVNMPVEIEEAIMRLRVAEYNYATCGRDFHASEDTARERFRRMNLADRMASELRSAIHAAIAKATLTRKEDE